MKRVILILVIIILAAGGVAAWIFLGPATSFKEKTKTLYISSKAASKKSILDSLRKNDIITNEKAFSFLADRMNYWKTIKPGRYDIPKGSSLMEILRMLRNGKQTPVDLVITKFRTKEDFAKLVGRKFETDSATMMAFLNSEDSLQPFDTDPEQAVVNVLPDKYTYFWNSTPSMIYEKLYKESQKFWTEERKQKAADLGLSPAQVYILASIVEEETTNHSEKDTIASVYLNRLKKGEKLQADPTAKFAVRQFHLKRVTDIIKTESPYNTYYASGLPPGPICTPSRLTIDKVLNPAKTNYMFFVARPYLGGHTFSVTFEEHKKKAIEFRKTQYGDGKPKSRK